MLNKSINLQKEIKAEENRTVAFVSSQISSGYGVINFSIQVIDKNYITDNPKVLYKEYFELLENVKNEAINNGWDALKEPEPIQPEVLENTEAQN